MIDLDFEEEMATAVEVLRDRIDEETIPAFVPSRSRSPLLAAAAVVVILGLGVIWGVFARGSDEASNVIVATQPDTSDDGGLEGSSPGAGDDDDAPASPNTGNADDTEEAEVEPNTGNPTVTEEAATNGPPALALSLPQGEQLLGQITSASDGQFIVPLPSGSAWNIDETALLLYRTGDGPVGHIAVSAVTGELIADVDLDAPDIEQIYWHPTNPELLVAVEGNEVWSFDVTSAERSLLWTLSSCPLADADPGHPSPPSQDGTLVVLCDSADGRQLVQFNLLTGVETAEPVASAVDSVYISPSGSTVLSKLDNDGSAIARTAGSDVLLDLGQDLFEFVTVGGVEMIASTRYTGDAIGSVVLFDLFTGSAEVIVGPDAGNEFPPVGPSLHASGSRLVLSSAGPAEGELAGRVLLVDLDRVGQEIVGAIAHDSVRDNNGYWSDAFVTLSPSGRFAAYSSDRGGDAVDTTIVEFPP